MKVIGTVKLCIFLVNCVDIASVNKSDMTLSDPPSSYMHANDPFI